MVNNIADSNRGPLVSEATTLPTAPQPLPFFLMIYLASGLSTLGLKVFELHDLRHDEAFLEVGVNSAGSLRSLCPLLK